MKWGGGGGIIIWSRDDRLGLKTLGGWEQDNAHETYSYSY